MIDILLVLLIIFLVVAPATPYGFGALVPQPGAPDRATPANPVVITVGEGGSIRLNQEPVALTDLRRRLLAIFGNEMPSVVFLRADANLEYREIASVIDIARGAGIERVALLTRETGPASVLPRT
jgi:biopolymer transport protein ExbD